MRRRATKKLSFDQLESRRLLHGGGFARGFARDVEPPTVEERVDAIFDSLDDNEDGMIAADEVSDRHWSRLAEADADEDGNVSMDELNDHVTTKLEERVANIVDRVFSRHDQNEDGLVTQDEVSERHWERLSASDANEDTAVSADELTEQLRTRFGLADAEDAEG